MTTPIYKEGNPMTTPVYAAVNDQLAQDDAPVAENGQMAEEATTDPADGATDVDEDAEQALVVDEWDAESTSPVMPTAPQPPPAVGSTPPSATWSEILAMFVDDPRACVELAASLVDDSVEAHVMSIKEQQQSLLSGWRDDGADTEDLRVALQHYRTFWTRLKDLPAQA
jgi:hypothetical protein